MPSRRDFINNTAVGIFGLLPLSTSAINNKFKSSEDLIIQPESRGLYSLYPTTNPEAVRMVVGAAHTNIEEVKRLVTERPELAKATYDWGFGDVESALGAASHMGRKDIADFLIKKGARPDIFAFAMLGRINAVKAMIEDMPGIQRIKGPHGFTLLHHAQMRLRRKNVEGIEKEQQEALVDYLENLGDANLKNTSLDISPEEQKYYIGKYVFGTGEDEFFNVSPNSRGMLFMSRGDYTGRALLKVDQHIFAPGGAPSVKVVFTMDGGYAKSMSIHDPTPIITAERI